MVAVAAGVVLSATKIGDGVGGIPAETLSDGDNFGRYAESIGDLNGDGVEDLVVGAASDDDGFTDAGAVYILFLRGNGSAASYQKISATAGGGSSLGLASADFFGQSVSRLEQPAGDQPSMTRLVVGSPFADADGDSSGEVHVIRLFPNGTAGHVQ